MKKTRFSSRQVTAVAPASRHGVAGPLWEGRQEMLIDYVRRLSLAASLAAGLLISGEQTSAAAQDPQQTKREAVEAYSRGGLHAAARVSGGHFTHLDSFESDLRFTSLEAFLELSDRVVIGTVGESRSRLTSDGRLALTHYKVVVTDDLANPAGAPSELVLQVPGGKVRFDDGTSASVETPGFRRPLAGERLLLILKALSPGDSTVSTEVAGFAGERTIYRLPVGLRGSFLLPDNQHERVIDKSFDRDGLSNRIRRQSASVFIQEVRQTLKAIGQRRAPEIQR